ncbi:MULTISPECIES: sensor histidine kinase [Actinoalloteichus]|uniref:histidine kinase n=1 Tax=Actinoalloteichus fjordicus TaxID=1612552 RepID=A0AAC9PSC3_9PSEU|nr:MULTISPECIES: histidine kinase [Actinoalloteichus]APU14870.1 signal transduction histidine kinase [Actinoalloteichus fjordicus]APU20839.1 signal transduction histidine kinase [Actinoalloteichus sp. GBA129-24]
MIESAARSSRRPGTGARGVLDSLVAIVHCLTTLALSLCYLVVLLVFALGVLLVPLLFVGIPIAAAACWAALGVEWIELHRISAVLGLDLTGLDRERLPEDDLVPRTRRQGLLRRGLNRRALTALAYTLVQVGWGITSGAVLLFALSASTAYLGHGVLLVASGGADSRQIVLSLGGGVVGLVVSGWLARRFAMIEVLLLRRMVLRNKMRALRRQVEELRERRLRMVDAAEAERRRLERDLHDGAQQRLLSVTMTLTRARARIGKDTAAAEVLLAEAHQEAKAAMTELRDLARGLHPAILTDHGLDGALPAVASRCAVPVGLDVELDSRPSARTEGVAYFVVSEALTNITKHSEATTASVRLHRDGERLWIRIADDGVGGATVDGAPGGGLAGLIDRVWAVDGELALSSPPGGPTVVTVDLPWEA